MSESLSAIVEPLLGWFINNKRELPWRQDHDPYHVWISEIMLQQTRIEAVMGYYARFLDALPDVKSLSEVDDDALMKLWEGLGYYSRARNLKKAAQKIMTEYNGVFPQTYAQLLTLPGIGEYTAGAIASICFNEKVPAVDGNVLRVIARVRGDRENVLLPEVKKKVGKELTSIMPDASGAFNEGLMELGERICLPSGAPLCDRCPLKAHCTACQKGLTQELPVRVKTMKRRREEKTVLIITSPEGKIAVEKRPDSGLLAGMYQLPNIEGFYDEKELTDILREHNLSPVEITFLKKAKHVFSHIDWYMRAYQVIVERQNDRFLWVTEEELHTACSLPTAFKKLLR